MKYLIWSVEHNGWWKGSKMGYMEYLGAAGVYSQIDAFNLVLQANRYNMDDIHEALVPLIGDIQKEYDKAVFELEQKMDQDSGVEGDSLIRIK